MLAKVHEMLGDRKAARSAIELCEEIGGQEAVIDFAITNTVQARLALAQGDNEAAERWAPSAADRAFETDFTFVQGEALLTLSFVLQELARREESASAASRALELFDAKGDSPYTAQARARLEELAAPA